MTVSWSTWLYDALFGPGISEIPELDVAADIESTDGAVVLVVGRRQSGVSTAVRAIVGTRLVLRAGLPHELPAFLKTVKAQAAAVRDDDDPWYVVLDNLFWDTSVSHNPALLELVYNAKNISPNMRVILTAKYHRAIGPGIRTNADVVLIAAAPANSAYIERIQNDEWEQWFAHIPRSTFTAITRRLSEPYRFVGVVNRDVQRSRAPLAGLRTFKAPAKYAEA